MAKTVYQNDAAPATPPSGYTSIYVKTDKKPYYKDDTGTEYPMTGVSAPAGEIVFGTGTGVTSDPTFTYDPTTGAFVVEPPASSTPNDFQLTAAYGTAGVSGAGVQITAGSGGTGTTNGGDVTLNAGTSDPSNGNGGSVTLNAGTGGGTSGTGGSVSLVAQQGATAGGNVNITAGASTTASGTIDFYVDNGGGTSLLSARMDGFNTSHMIFYSNTGSLYGIQGENGPANGGLLEIEGGKGGTGGGGSVSISGGSPGTASNSFGGGVFLFGIDGDSTGTAGGTGGNVGSQAGYGGNASLSGTATGGDAGQMYITGGIGGSATNTGANADDATAGVGSRIRLTAGTGGNATITNGGASGDATAGNGGDIELFSGLAGTSSNAGSGVSTQGTPGNVKLMTRSGHAIHRAGFFSVDGDAQSNMYVAMALTTNASPTEMTVNFDQRLVLANNSVWRFEVHLAAYETVGSNVGWTAGYEIKGVIKNVATTTALVGTPSVTVTADDSSGTWVVTVTADDTFDALVISVTGESSTTIRWVAFVRTVEVTA